MSARRRCVRILCAILATVAVLMLSGCSLFDKIIENRYRDSVPPQSEASADETTFELAKDPGYTAILEAEVPDGEASGETDGNMNAVSAILRQRLAFLGYGDATVAVDGAQATVEGIPSDADVDETLGYLKESWTVEAKDSKGQTVFDGRDVASAKVEPSEEANIKFVVTLGFTEEGHRKLAEAAKTIATRTANKKNYIKLLIDGEELCTSYVTQEFTRTARGR